MTDEHAGRAIEVECVHIAVVHLPVERRLDGLVAPAVRRGVGAVEHRGRGSGEFEAGSGFGEVVYRIDAHHLCQCFNPPIRIAGRQRPSGKRLSVSAVLSSVSLATILLTTMLQSSSGPTRKERRSSLTPIERSGNLHFPSTTSALPRTSPSLRPICFSPSPILTHALFSSLSAQARMAGMRQDDCKVFSNPFMASLSKHRQLEQASFDKLRMSRHQCAASLCNRPGHEKQHQRDTGYER